MSHRLFVQLQGETIKMLSLDMTLLSIGRTPDNGLALPDPAVAIRHAEVRLLEGRFVITDLGYGETFLAGKRLVPFQPQVLVEGVLVQVGPYILAFQPGVDLPPPLPRPELPLPPTEFQRLRLPPALPRLPMEPAPSGPSQYLEYLPALFGESEFLGRYLMIFQNIWEPLQHRQDHLELYFAASTAPVSFLQWLAAWLGLEMDPHWPESRKRQWLAEAMHLLRWRGTPYGVRRAIELGCGVTPHVTEDARRPFYVRIALPDLDAPEWANSPDGTLSREEALHLVARHVPAWVEYEVVFLGQDAAGSADPSGQGGAKLKSPKSKRTPPAPAPEAPDSPPPNAAAPDSTAPGETPEDQP